MRDEQVWKAPKFTEVKRILPPIPCFLNEALHNPFCSRTSMCRGKASSTMAVAWLITIRGKHPFVDSQF